ncbi:serine-rich coiled-coil domain-containing protein 1-like [Erythrolamprus reginae]|uniref:serine-rich coiled-coil domain-containing protein 1-like n=1 Tax=Erythrolamprus reginae TaxID=121349 RepID=UPI00396C5558
MGDSTSRRSIIVSRLPIFRRSINRRHDSLPSSPTSNSTAGVHSSSPSSTNSSSGSTGKRRSLFRTPSISFSHRKGSDQKAESSCQNVAGVLNGTQSGHNVLQKLGLEEPTKNRSRHSVSFGSSRSKKITRSLTEDFEKGREPSTNKNVFINCIRSGKNESDDSGFAEAHTKSSVKHSTRRLLTKSFSTHYRFSKPAPPSQSVSCVQPSSCLLEIKPSVETDPVSAKSSPSECVGSSLLSADLTTVQTPSEFLALTEDSVSEVDGLPACGNPHPETLAHNVSTSQTFAASPLSRKTHLTESISPSVETHRARNVLLAETSAFSEILDSNRKHTKVLLPELFAKHATHPEEVNSGGKAQLKTFVLSQGEAVGSPPQAQRLQRDQQKARVSPEHAREAFPGIEPKMAPLSSEPQCFQTQQANDINHAKVSLPSSLSPFREGRFLEKRLRSSSEGTAGNSRMILKPKDGNLEDINSLRKQRTSSPSSKMNSLDVLNNLGSCDLDEDDLMLDLEFLEDPQHRHSVCREDSHQSIVSCAATLLTPVESAESKKKEFPQMPEVTKQNLSLKLSKEVDRGETRCPRVNQLANSPSIEWPFTAMEEGGGLESLPFRLMMQDCTAVKTMLLKMKRVLQESSDMSPATSINSLPVSPLTEEPLPFKDIMKDECLTLKLQLKEKDELISQLHEELEKARHLQSVLVSQVDKSTQTEVVGQDALWNSACADGSVYKRISISLVPTF